MFSARVTALLLLCQLLSVSKARRSLISSSSSSYRMMEDSGNVNTLIVFEMDTIPAMPVDTTAIYIIPSTSVPSIISTSEFSTVFPVSSLQSMEVTLPLITSTSVIMVDTTMVTTAVTSVAVGTAEESSASGGVIAAIVVSVLILVIAAAVAVVLLATCVRRKKRTRSYSLNSFRSTETDRSRVYVNVTATSISQPCVENGGQHKEGSTLNQYTTSPPDSGSSYHIYEMTEMTDDEVTGKPEGAAQEVVDSPESTKSASPLPQRNRTSAYTRGSGSYKQKKSPYHRQPPRRYNTVGEYEFMMPQLQAAAAAAAMKKHTSMPTASTTDDHYSEISDEEEQQQSDTYIFMQTEQPSEEFSSFLSKWFDVDKDADTTQRDRTISEVTEEDVYITMQ